ncbi:MAG TPA: endolytic transglycosylase MltG [Firmicutes bacterium]|nr:endolytic transglycosylase MltG [Bacillota bacterium]
MEKHDMIPHPNRVLPGYRFIRFLSQSICRLFRPVFRDRSRFFLAVFALFCFGFIFLVGQAVWIYNGVQVNRKVFNPHDSTIDIPLGSSVFQIGSLLEEKGLIKNRKSFIWYLYLTGQQNSLKAGHYKFGPDLTFRHLLRELKTGRPIIYRVTIPEGYTIAEIGRLLSTKGLVDYDRFQELLHDRVFLRSQLIDFAPVSGEGFLFPDTYEFAKGATEEEILSVFFQRFRQVWAEVTREVQPPAGFTPVELVTLASIVEGEAKVEAERPIIAGIFYNRLRRGQLLQSCATVQYALGERKPRLLYKDLQVDSPYNTYLYKGLPPTPIGNPGRASLQAALSPADTDYLYFFAKSDGTHVFSRTYREHLRAQNLLAQAGEGKN